MILQGFYFRALLTRNNHPHSPQHEMWFPPQLQRQEQSGALPRVHIQRIIICICCCLEKEMGIYSGKGSTHFCANTARAMNSLSLCHLCTLLGHCYKAHMSDGPSWPQQSHLNSGELGENKQMGPAGKVCPAPLAISSLCTVGSMRASTLCEHQNIMKVKHAGKLGSLLTFPWIKQAYSIEKQHSHCKKRVDDEVMGVRQERTGAQLTPGGSNTPKGLSDLGKSVLTTVMDWKLTTAAVRGGR